MSTSLRRYALSLTKTHDAAEDLLQDTLERAWRSREDYDQSRCLKRWLIVIMRNRFFDTATASKRLVQDSDGIYLSKQVSVAIQEHCLELKMALARIDLLPKIYRDAMRAVVIDELSYESGATLVGCPVPTLKSRVQRARRALQGPPAARAV